MIQMESKWHQMEVPNCSKIESKWRASEWVVANCHAVSCMQRTCSISIEIFLKLWASKKKSLCESYLNQINIRSFESIALPVPYQDRFLKCGPGSRNNSFFNKVALQFPYLILDLISGAFWTSFGSTLAPKRPPGLPKTPPDASKMLQNGGPKQIKTKKHTFSKNTHLSSVF